MPIRPIEHGIFASSGAAAGGGFAYFMGTGQDENYTYMTFIDKVAYADDSRSTLSATMTDGHKDANAMANPGSAAYCTGGENAGGVHKSTDKIAFSDDSHSVLTSELSANRYGGACLSNAGVKGYYCGGNQYPIVSTIQPLTFSTEAWSTASSTLNYSPLNPGSFNNNAVAGYVLGTYTGSTTQIDKMTYPGESVSTLTATLSPGGGYISGGLGDTGVAGYTYIYAHPYTGVQKVTFSTDALSTITATLTKIRYTAQTSATGTAGYWMAGNTDTANATDTIKRMEFPGETISTVSTVLSDAVTRATAATNELALA